MGHAVGLGHFPDRYLGRTQVMNPIVPDVQAYQAGDVNGLRYLVAETAVLRAQSIVSGSVDSWQVRRGGLAVTGWAIVGRTSQFADIAVTRDGRSVYRITTNTPRPDIVERYDSRWPNPGFTGARVPMVDGTHRYCVVASASSSDPVRLACRSLDYPPPAPPAEVSPLPALGRAPIEVWWTSATAEVALGVGAALLLAVVALLAVRRRRSRTASPPSA
jgi:MYXO-CTERM domain-containing protein